VDPEWEVLTKGDWSQKERSRLLGLAVSGRPLGKAVRFSLCSALRT
jgi:hypothetical protein